MRTLTVNHKFNNKHLNSFLMNEFPCLTQNTFYKALRKKDIRVNDIKVNENIIIHEGDNVKIYILDKFLFCEEQNLDIIYEDENILVLNKSKGIEVTGENSLSELVHKIYNSNCINPCHRLDRNTSGLVLFAKSNEALNILLDKFKNQEISKFYRCKVVGILSKKHNILNAYLFKDNKKSVVYVSDFPEKGYRPITTEYAVIDENKDKNYSILEVILHTGRTHQIRAHLAHIGHPIIGDGKYGINSINKTFNEKTQNLVSYKLRFDFRTDAGILNYLKGKEIKIK